MTNSKVGNFTACYQSLFLKACGLGLNQAVALLVMACGTGKDHKTTSWSSNAIEKHGGISRRLALKAINSLEEHNIITRIDGTSKVKPKYKIQGDDSELIWIPKSFVMTRTDESGQEIDSPLKKLRRDGGINYILTIFFLYKYHNLVSDGGFSRDLIHKKATLDYVQSWGAWDFYTTKRCKDYSIQEDHPFFEETGLSPIEFERIFSYLEVRYELVLESHYLFDDVDNDSGMLYPVKGSEDFENIIRDKALEYIENQKLKLLESFNSVVDRFDPMQENLAAEEKAEVDKENLYQAIYNNHLLIPIPQHLSDKASVSIVYKMRYRPLTGQTRAWQKRVIEESEKYSRLFDC